MKPGTKPLPRNLRIIRGMRDQRPAKDRPAKPIPEPPVKIPLPPDCLTEEEVDVFVTRARLLAGMRVMTEADVDMLVIYVRNVVQRDKAWKKVHEIGEIIKAPNGGAIWNPWLSIAKAADKMVHKIGVEFGLSPSSRNRVSE